MDSLYVRDAALVSPKGVILCAMGKPAREREPAINGRTFKKSGIAIAGTVTGDGRIEGGDLIWFDETCLAVGRTYRTNDEGIRQLREILGPGVHVEVAVLPHYKGTGDVFHLIRSSRPSITIFNSSFAADASFFQGMADRTWAAPDRGADRNS
jgi:N-dimethylarginine dimethylaminohydrolase